MVYKIFPNDLNSENTVFGGVVLGLMDRTALVVAERHSGKSCVTVSVDAVRFLAPGRKGDNLICTAQINRAWTSSMEIGLTIVAEHPFSGETRKIVEAFFVSIATPTQCRPFTLSPSHPLSAGSTLLLLAALAAGFIHLPSRSPVTSSDVATCIALTSSVVRKREQMAQPPARPPVPSLSVSTACFLTLL